ncbi:MAG: c-type cytochrome [Rhodocyclaceae bacterium]|nr:c-type cytochrome [Rhodocyclaceae bacterium]
MNRAMSLAAGLIAVLPGLASAAKEPPPPLPYFAGNCFNCHGTDGRGKSAIPPLAGKDRTLFVEQMKGYRTGTLQATIMHQLAKGYTDEEIAVLADWFAKQKP